MWNAPRSPGRRNHPIHTQRIVHANGRRTIGRSVAGRSQHSVTTFGWSVSRWSSRSVGRSRPAGGQPAASQVSRSVFRGQPAGSSVGRSVVGRSVSQRVGRRRHRHFSPGHQELPLPPPPAERRTPPAATFVHIAPAYTHGESWERRMSGRCAGRSKGVCAASACVASALHAVPMLACSSACEVDGKSHRDRCEHAGAQVVVMRSPLRGAPTIMPNK